MKMYRLLIFSVLFFQTAFGQKPQVKWGQPFDLDKEESFVKVLESDENNFYLQTINYKVIKFGIVNADNPTPETPGLIKLDKNFKVVKKKSLKEITDKSKVLGVEVLGDNFVLVISKYNKTEKMYQYFITLINKDLEVIKENMLAWSIPKDRSDFEVTYSFSPDHSMMTFYCKYTDLKKDENGKFKFKVFDEELKTVNQKDLEFPQMSDKISISHSVVTKEGVVYLMAKVSNGKDEKDKTQHEFDLYAYKYNPTGKNIEIKIPLPADKDYLSVYAKSSVETNDIYIFAQYTTLENNGVTGYQVSMIDAESNDVVFSQTNNLDVPLIKRANEINYDKTKSKDPGLSAYYAFSYVKINADNSMYVVMEKYYIERNAIQNSPYRTYHAQNLVVMNIDKNGKQKWANLIPKVQFYNSMTTYLNFFAKTYSDKLFLFYNETEKNIENSLSITDAPKKFNDLKDFYLMSVEISSTGQMKKSVFLTPEKDPYGYIVKEYVSIGANEFLMIGKGYKENTIVLGTGTFD